MINYSMEFDTLSELLSIIGELENQEDFERIDIMKTPNGYSVDVTSNPYDGTEGQDRDNYTDEQDRENYTVED